MAQNIFQRLLSGSRPKARRIDPNPSSPSTSPERKWNAFTRSKKASGSKKERIFYKEVEARTVRDLNEWKQVILLALDEYLPDRQPLYDMYDWALRFDGHLRGLLNTRVMKLTEQRFKLLGPDGMEAKDLSLEMNNSTQLEQLMRHAMDSIFFGHSLIHVSFWNDGTLRSVEVVPRQNVDPTTGEFVLTYATERERFSNRRVWTEEGKPLKGVYKGLTSIDSFIEVGEPYSLGLLETACYWQVIAKGVVSSWFSWAERFGMPFIALMATGEQLSQQDLDQMRSELAEMGEGGVGAFNFPAPNGLSMEMVETARTDAWKVYDELIEMANFTNSKLILGQTMLTDDGSSRAQAQVHERVANTILQADKRQIKGVMNNQVLPLLAIRDPRFAGMRFEWRKLEEATTMDSLQMLKLANELGGGRFHVRKEDLENILDISLEDGHAAEPNA